MALRREDLSALRKSSLACGCLEPLNSLNLNQDDQIREELKKTVIHDNHFIHVLIRLSPPSPATRPHQLLVHLMLGQS
jgi:hypothetical protein